MDELRDLLKWILVYIQLQSPLTPKLTRREVLTAGQSTELFRNSGSKLRKVTIQNVTPSGAGQEVHVSRDPITATTDGFILDRLESRDFILERGEGLHGTAGGAAPEVAIFEY